MNRILYFAYGSNMLLDRLEERVRKVIKIGNYILQDWQLTFDAGYFLNTYANIKPAIGAKVEGVLYQLNEHQIGFLDQYEGYPRNYQKVYKIINLSGIIEPVIIFAYVSDNIILNNPRKPDLSYINIILAGCLENKLKETYEKVLEYKLNNYKLKSPKTIKKTKNYETLINL
jgi:gamma-glutamylcyclotransferase (GGCT)/AIG2-like uncharacterized protein YtfP